MLGGVADNGDEDQTDKGLADVGGLDNVVDAADEVVGADGDEESDDNKDGSGGNGADDGLLMLFLGFPLGGLGGLVVARLGLGVVVAVKEVAVGAELEEEVEDVEDEKNDGGTAGKDENGVALLPGATLVEDGVELKVVVSRVTRELGERGRTAAGRTREAEERVMSEQVVWATAAENCCSVPLPLVPRWTRPPKRKHMPMTRSRLERMEPSIEDWTTSIWPSRRATMLTCVLLVVLLIQLAIFERRTISSTALPKVALSRPPSVSPSLREISSVAKDRTAARGIMAKKLRVKTVVALHLSMPAAIPMGTMKRRKLT